MNYSHWSPIARQVLYLYGLQQRIDQFSELCPKILNTDIGWKLIELLKIKLKKPSSVVHLNTCINFELDVTIFNLT